MSLAATPNKPGDEKPARGDVEYFEQHVRPLLARHCYECHSGQAKIVQGGLLLDSKPGWQKGGDSGPAIVPGEPEKSLLVRAVTYTDEDLQMPPKGKLGDAEIALLSTWVKRGAPDPRTTAISAPPAKKPIDIAAGRKHWAFQPLKAPDVPERPPRDTRRDAASPWARTAVDRFVLERLEHAKLAPNPIADRRTLIRRAYFDLLGLPPEPEEIEKFVNDPAADAYERLIDRLLSSPHFGERWARHWLDLARWAESHGFEQDYDRPYAYPYRDFVIHAFNDDLPYDTFVKWQLAGDEYEPGNPLALAATGFLAAGVHATQITANQAEKERYDELDDMARTTGTAMLGLTVGCARCHDHKYDPISNEDYYRIVSTFTTTVRSNQLINTDPNGYGGKLAEFEQRHRPVAAALERHERELAGKFDDWLLKESKKPTAQPHWLVLDTLAIASETKATFKRLDDDSYLARHVTSQFREAYTVTGQLPAGKYHGLKIEALDDDSLPSGGPGLGADGGFEINKLKLTIAGGKGNPQVKLVRRSDQAQPASKDPRKPAEQSWVVKAPGGRPQAAEWALATPLAIDAARTFTFAIDFGRDRALGRFRISLEAEKPTTAESDPSATAWQALQKLHAEPTKRSALTSDERRALLARFNRTDARWRELRAEVDKSLAGKPRPQLQWMMISSEGVPAIRLHTQGPDFYDKTYQLKRGDPNQKLGEAAPGFLQVLLRPNASPAKWQQPAPSPAHASWRRRTLAEWMTDCDDGAGATLARVVVNRLWQHHFGRGIVGTPSDFGLAGERPTHPELLEYLATELVSGGWRLKRLHKLMMTSAVYMQTCDMDAVREKLDIDNRLLWHREPQRLEAEVARDAMLAVSGLLDPTMYGPGSLDPEQRRRSIYFFVKRSQLVPMMMLFDAPDTLVDIAVRSQTTIAPQALMLLNSTLVRHYAEGMARRALPDGAHDERAGVVRAYQLALGRNPTTREQNLAAQFLAAQTAAYESEHRSGPATLAWADFCQALLGTNEFIYVR